MDSHPTTISVQRGSGDSVYRSTTQQEPTFSVDRCEEIQNHIKNISRRQEWSQNNQYFEQTVKNIIISDPETRTDVQQIRNDLRMMFSECNRGFGNVERSTGVIGTVIEDIITAMKELEQNITRMTKRKAVVVSQFCQIREQSREIQTLKGQQEKAAGRTNDDVEPV